LLCPHRPAQLKGFDGLYYGICGLLLGFLGLAGLPCLESDLLFEGGLLWDLEDDGLIRINNTYKESP
jgi:hypothetical protein